MNPIDALNEYRQNRHSVLNEIAGFDDPEVLQAVRDIAKAKRWQPKLKDFADNALFSEMLDSILWARIGLALVSPEELASKGMDSDLSNYGYEFDPERSIWKNSTRDEAEQNKHPWYRTSREAIDALYDDALRDDNNKLVADFERSELYDEMNKRLAAITAQTLAEDPTLAEKLVKGGIMSSAEVLNDKTGQRETKYFPKKYDEKNELYTLASSLLPMRTVGMLNDPEILARSSTGEKLGNVAKDLGELGMYAFNPIGTRGVPLLARMLSGPTRKLMPKIADWAGGKGYAWLNNTAENALGTFGTDLGFQVLDRFTDTDNSEESQGIDVGDAAIAGGIAGAIPLMSKLSRGLPERLLEGKPKLRQMMADSYNTNPIGGKEISPMQASPYASQLLKSRTYNDFTNAPYLRTQGAGYTHYATPKIQPFQKTTDMTAADVDDVLVDRIARATGDMKAAEAWYRANVAQRDKLRDRGDLQVGNTDRSSGNYFIEDAENFRKTQADHPASSYKTEFAMPITKYEADNPEVLDKLTQAQRDQRHSQHRKDNAERTFRERLINQFVPLSERTARPKGTTGAKGLDLRAENGKTRKFLGIMREIAPHVSAEWPGGEPAFNVIRNGVPLRQRKEEE